MGSESLSNYLERWLEIKQTDYKAISDLMWIKIILEKAWMV